MRPLNGLTLTLDGTFSVGQREVAARVRAAGGAVASSLTRAVTHVLAADPARGSAKLRKARERGLPVVDEAWLEGGGGKRARDDDAVVPLDADAADDEPAAKARRVEAAAPAPAPAPAPEKKKDGPPFEGMVFCLSGEFSSGKEPLQRMITQGGGRVVSAFSGRVTHVATDDMASKTVKVKKARKKKLPVVGESWIVNRSQGKPEAAAGSAAGAPPPPPRPNAGPSWLSNRDADNFAELEAKAMERYRKGNNAGRYQRYRITPVRFVKVVRSHGGRWAWADRRDEVYDFDVTDGAGRVWRLRGTTWDGDADANTGAFGTVTRRPAGAPLVRLDGANHGDCVTLYRTSGDGLKFKPHRDGDFPGPDSDQFRDDAFLDYEFRPASQLAQVAAVAAHLGSSAPFGTYVNEQPMDLRVKFKAALVDEAFREVFPAMPADLAGVVAAYDPAYLPVVE